MSSSMRDKIRSATLGSQPQFKTKRVEINGAEVELRQPSIKDRREILNKCMNGDGTVDMMEFQIRSIMHCARDPETGGMVFEEEDYDVIMSNPTHSWVDELGQAVQEVMNVDTKNLPAGSGETGTGSYSS